MCLSPNVLADGTRVACRGCAVCRNNRLDDLTGRCLAEQATSSATFAVTLTYRDDVPSSAVLTYHDVQTFLKRLRFDGFKVRYICAGEYGSLKGRAHWHIVLFFKGARIPQVEINKRIEWQYWPHGFCYFQQPQSGGFRYLMKYALKDQVSESATRHLAMSKKPPLGYEFFMRLAGDLVERGLTIQSPEYAFAHVRDRHGRARRYWLQGRMREMFLDAYLDKWRERYGAEAPATQWLLERHLDPKAKRERELEPDFRPLSSRERARWAAIRSLGIPHPDVEPFEAPDPCGLLFLDRKGRDLIQLFDNDTGDAVIRGHRWPLLRKDAARQLEAAGLTGRSLRLALDGCESLWLKGAITKRARQVGSVSPEADAWRTLHSLPKQTSRNEGNAAHP